jgi:hypothetical protein
MRTVVARIVPWGCTLGLLALALAAPAAASPLTWTLSNVTFAGGGTAVGSFVANVDTSTISSWNISVAGLEPSMFDTTFSAPGVGALVGNSLVFVGGGSALVAMPSSPLTDQGGTRSLTGFFAGSGDGTQFDAALTGGNLTALADPMPPSPVPEPPTLITALTGLLGLLLLVLGSGLSFKANGAKAAVLTPFFRPRV